VYALEANFFIQIPPNVWTDRTLSANEKMMFGIIKALSNNEKNICYASNAYLAESFGVSATTASKWIKTLKKKKLIRVQVNRNKNMEVESRFIRLTPPPSDEGRVPLEMRGGSPLKKQHSNKSLITTTNIGSEIPNLNEVEEFWEQESLDGNPKKFFYWRTNQGWKVKAGWKVSAIDWSDREKKIESNQRKRNLDSIEESFTDTEWAKSSIQH